MKSISFLRHACVRAKIDFPSNAKRAELVKIYQASNKSPPFEFDILDFMTVPELRKYCKEKGFKGYSSCKKRAELLKFARGKRAELFNLALANEEKEEEEEDPLEDFFPRVLCDIINEYAVPLACEMVQRDSWDRVTESVKKNIEYTRFSSQSVLVNLERNIRTVYFEADMEYSDEQDDSENIRDVWIEEMSIERTTINGATPAVTLSTVLLSYPNIYYDCDTPWELERYFENFTNEIEQP